MSARQRPFRRTSQRRPAGSGRSPAVGVRAATPPPEAPAQPPQRRPTTQIYARRPGEAPPPQPERASRQEAPAGDACAPAPWRHVAGVDAEQTLRVRGDAPAPAPQALRGGYRLLHELGRGGMGAVHAAEQRAFGRTVAVKSLIEDGPESRRAFWAEAIATARLEHPNIVPVHDLVQTPARVPQLIMKRVEGATWKARLRRGADAEQARAGAEWPIERHLEILLKVCDAVSFAHTRGILHRDLKPENVMVGDFGEVLVMDWGCACAFGERPVDPLLPHVRDVATVAGTPAYIAPEMAMAQGDRMGPWSDVYLLGAILYEILTGTPPHRGGDVHAVLEAAARGEVQHPAERAPDRDANEELAELALAAMRADPAKRIPDARTFADGIRAYLQHSQAATLARRAREHLASASAGADADEHYRRAIGCCEQALDLWPAWRGGKRIFVQVALESARHALASGVFRVAERQAAAAERLARELRAESSAEQAARIARDAAHGARAQLARARQVARLRVGLGVLAAVLVAGLSGMLAKVGAAQRASQQALAETQRARAAAEDALARLGAEQEGRMQLARQAAPRFVAEAEEHMRGFRWEQALASARIAVSLDDSLGRGWRLLAELLAGAGDIPGARAALARSPAPNGRLMRALDTWASKLAGRRPGGAELLALAGDLEAAGCNLVSGYLQRDTRAGIERVLADARARLLAANPGVLANRLDWSAQVSDGDVRLSIVRSGELRDITALTGLPITHLTLTECPIVDIHALAGMPLRFLDLYRTGIEDLAPIKGMRLEHLSIRETGVRDLAPLAGMPLRHLDLGSTKVRDFSVLDTLQLEHLRVDRTQLRSFEPLSRHRLRSLSLADLPVADLAPLRGMPLTWLDLRSTAVADVAVLSGKPLTWLNLAQTRVADLGPLARMPLEHLDLARTAVSDLTPLADAPMRSLVLWGVRGATTLPALPQLELLDLRDSGIADLRMLAPFKALRSIENRWLPPVGLELGRGTAGLAASAREVALLIGDVPALASAVRDLRRIEALAGWQSAGGRGDPPECFVNGASRYALIPLQLTYAQAQGIADLLGGRIVCLETAAEISAVHQRFASAEFFIGASHVERPGTWTWIGGAPVTEGAWLGGHSSTGKRGDHHQAFHRPAANGKPGGWATCASWHRCGLLVEWSR